MGKDVLSEGGDKVWRQRGPKEGKLSASLDRHLQLAFVPATCFFPHASWNLRFFDVFFFFPGLWI